MRVSVAIWALCIFWPVALGGLRVALRGRLRSKMVYAWLASNPEKQHLLQRQVRTGSQAMCSCTIRALSEPPSLLDEVSPHRIYAFVRLEVRGRYTPLMLLEPEERAQLRFWEAALGRRLSQELCIFSVVEVVCLRRPGGGYFQFMNVMNLNRRGNVISLSELERDTLAGITHHDSAAAARIVIRVPAPYAVLLSQRRWRSFALPDLSTAVPGTVPMSIPWGLLQEQVPACTAMQWQGAAAYLGRETMMQEIADALRDGLSALPAEGPRRERAERLIVCAQAMADDTDVDGFKRRVLLSSPQSAGRATRYRTDYFLKVFLTAQNLKSCTSLPLVVKDVVNMLFSAPTAAVFGAVAECASVLVPSKGQLSKSRVLIDGALCLFMRHLNARRLRQGGCIRYIMADSSMQHGREFEAVRMITLERAIIPKAFRAANRLINIRPFYFKHNVVSTPE